MSFVPEPNWLQPLPKQISCRGGRSFDLLLRTWRVGFGVTGGCVSEHSWGTAQICACLGYRLSLVTIPTFWGVKPAIYTSPLQAGSWLISTKAIPVNFCLCVVCRVRVLLMMGLSLLSYRKNFSMLLGTQKAHIGGLLPQQDCCVVLMNRAKGLLDMIQCFKL